MRWGVRLDEAGPWLAHLSREILFQEVILEQWCGVRFNPEPKASREPGAWPSQAPGAACQGQHVQDCLRQFGPALELACSTCGTSYERTGRLQ